MRVAAPSIALALAQTSVAATVPLQARDSNSTCSSVHIFTAKGNNEPYPGRQGKLVNAICDGLENCDYEDILFYNPVESPYCQSVEEGVANGIAQLNAYSARCPDTKLVVSGYSQGSHIVSDILGGGSGTFFQNCMTKPSPALDVNSQLGRQIAAVLTFGNTRHTANQPYNLLSGADKNGIFPRSGAQLANLATWTSKYHDYCAGDDPVCAQGDNVDDHLNYFDIYTDSAAEWVKQMLADADAVTTSTVAAASTTYTSTATIGADKTVATTWAYSNNTSGAAPQVTESAALSSIQSAVLAIPTDSSSEAITVTKASVDSSAVSSYASVWSATAVVTNAAGSAYTGIISAGATPKPSASGNGTNGVMPYMGAASSISGAVSGSVAAVLIGAVALLL